MPAQDISRLLLFQALLSEPVFESNLSQLRIIFGNKRPFTQTSSGIKRIRIEDDLTRVTYFGSDNYE